MSENTVAADPCARLLAKGAAVLTLLAMLTGILVAQAMTGQLKANPHALLAAHVNGITGAAWLAAIGWTLPMLRFGTAGKLRLAWLTLLATFANLFVTAGKAFFFVAGVGVDKDPANNVVFGLLGILVVGPSLVAAGAWCWALFGRAE